MKKLIGLLIVAIAALIYVSIKYNNAVKRLEEQEKKIEFLHQWKETHPETDTIPRNEHESNRL